MNKSIAIIAGEPNSISSEIIFKTWKLRKKFSHRPFFVIGSIDLLNSQKKKLKYQIKLKKITKNFKKADLKGNALPILDIKYNQKKPFEKISSKSNKYILACFSRTIKLSKSKKLIGFINCPISKEHLFKNKNYGITEFLAKSTGNFGKEVMLIYNKELSVSPMTTHIEIKKVSKSLNSLKIIKKINVINDFYKKNFKIKPKIAVLGLNPHNHSTSKKSEEKKIIIKAIKTLKRSGVKVVGPISPDSSFIIYKKYKFDVIAGMYHDQVLSPYKALFKFNAINITLGLQNLRISPDHGVAQNIVGKKIANPESLINSIKFFNNIK